MPVANGDLSGQNAFEFICENLCSPTFERNIGAHDSDITFLSEFLNRTVMQTLVKTYDSLDGVVVEPTASENFDLIKELTDYLADIKNAETLELLNIITNPHFQALIEAHDSIAIKEYTDDVSIGPSYMSSIDSTLQNATDAIRMVGVRKNPDEPLGITVRKDGNDLHIARILAGSTIAKQGLLHVGDIIKEINGQEVGDPDHLQEIMAKCSGSITFKILPNCYDSGGSSEIFLKAHFNYDPNRDSLIPCRDAGLPFLEGDILQVVNNEDPNWWQAKKIFENGPSGLIPSQALEEKRKSFVRPEYDYTQKSLLCGIVTKKKQKMMYQASSNSKFDRHEVMIYEEVARMPPFQRQTLVIIGAAGVGRRTLKRRLIKSDPNKFGSVIPHTSRRIQSDEIDGELYWFVTHEQIESDIAQNKFLEYGEHDECVYGTHFDSIRRVIRSRRMCILDINPQGLKAIKTSEFKPLVVFIASPPAEILRNMHALALQRGKPVRQKLEKDFRATVEESSQIERTYKHYFDIIIVNDNMDETYNKLRKAIESLSTESQWVPVSWVY